MEIKRLKEENEDVNCQWEAKYSFVRKELEQARKQDTAQMEYRFPTVEDTMQVLERRRR